MADRKTSRGSRQRRRRAQREPSSGVRCWWEEEWAPMAGASRPTVRQWWDARGNAARWPSRGPDRGRVASWPSTTGPTSSRTDVSFVGLQRRPAFSRSVPSWAKRVEALTFLVLRESLGPTTASLCQCNLEEAAEGGMYFGRVRCPSPFFFLSQHQNDSAEVRKR